MQPDDAFTSRELEGPLAAVDLGSNSFHMVVARAEGGSIRMVDRLRERVGLAEGLTEDGPLDAEVAERALACLGRFGERLVGVPEGRLRVVGTATFRRLEGNGFRERAERALGHPIEVVGGREEARLVYLGVAHTLGDDAGPRLVVDIGGASTECVLGQRFESERERSLSMGCVSWSARFFRGGKITRRRMEKARLAARVELEPIEREFRRRGWDSCIGASGTIRAAADIVRCQGWGESLTSKGLAKLEGALVSAGHVDRLELDGLEQDRRTVVAGGVAILTAVFEGLGIDTMRTSKGALREGVLHDLTGRIHHEDVRSRSVQDFALRFAVDTEQSARVLGTALDLFDQAAPEWGLDHQDRRWLTWAVELHEIGLAISWLGYHRHGEFMIAASDMRGFSRQGRAFLALLVRSHRQKMPLDSIEALPGKRRLGARRLILLLRLAVRLHRGRGATFLPPLELAVTGRTLRLVFPPGWLEEHPMTEADMQDEAAASAPLGLELQIA